MNNLAVYGTLRDNGCRSGVLNERDNIKIGLITLPIPYKMVTLGAFPALIHSDETHEVTLELWEVDDKTWQEGEWIEGFPEFYQRHTYIIDQTEYSFYVMTDGSVDENESIESGDWLKYLNVL